MNHCITLGDTPEPKSDYEFAIRIGDINASTVMTPDEKEVVERVVRRALAQAEVLRTAGGGGGVKEPY